PKATRDVAPVQRDRVKNTSPSPAPAVGDDAVPDAASPPEDTAPADDAPQQVTGGSDSGVAVDETVER
ncbi:MAG: hypothetical protein M3P39_00120, partial [Actinomycetota bacterium]|nr:hypothetical protein [Actinomycetota bacterium]